MAQLRWIDEGWHVRAVSQHPIQDHEAVWSWWWRGFTILQMFAVDVSAQYQLLDAFQKELTLDITWCSQLFVFSSFVLVVFSFCDRLPQQCFGFRRHMVSKGIRGWCKCCNWACSRDGSTGGRSYEQGPNNSIMGSYAVLYLCCSGVIDPLDSLDFQLQCNTMHKWCRRLWLGCHTVDVSMFSRCSELLTRLGSYCLCRCGSSTVPRTWTWKTHESCILRNDSRCPRFLQVI